MRLFPVHPTCRWWPITVMAIVACSTAARLTDAATTPAFTTIDRAIPSTRPSPIPVARPFGPDRDWGTRPFRLAVILIDFADVRHAVDHGADFYDGLIFGSRRPTTVPTTAPAGMSLADWCAAQSHGTFRLTGRTFDWVVVDRSYAEVHAMARRQAEDAYLRAAVSRVRQRDGDGSLTGFDAWFFIHAGPIGPPSANILWSHRWTLDGTRYLTKYETKSSNVSCHEFGHVLGLPDLYGKAAVGPAIGPWCAMATGYRGDLPGSLCVWSKARLGWCRPTVVDAGTSQSLLLRPIETHPQDAVLIPLNVHDGVGAEFLMLENRGGIGNDAGRPAGLLIWRVVRVADQFGEPAFTLSLPGPDDRPTTGPTGGEQLHASTRPADRIVVLPSTTAANFAALSADGRPGVTLSDIRRTDGGVAFSIGPARQR